MKYVLMYTTNEELIAAVPAERQQEVYAAVYRWFEEHGGAFVDSGAELQPTSTATTVRRDGGTALVVDGPYSEAKETVAGFSVVELADRDAVVALVRSWPMLELPGCSVEIRPMVTDYSQFE